MQRESRITQAIAPTVEGLGFRLVRAQVTGVARPVLQVMAEPSDGGAMTVEDCTTLSRALSAVLDVEDPIGGAYVLEVSSPGIDRPLTRPEDFERFKGFDARIELDREIEGQRRFRGPLGGLDAEGNVVIGEGDGLLRVPYGAIRRAKLLLTDALLAAHAKQAVAAGAQGDED